LFGGFARLLRLGSCLALRNALFAGCDSIGASGPAFRKLGIVQRGAMAFYGGLLSGSGGLLPLG
jgi:hypothetical protein